MTMQTKRPCNCDGIGCRLCYLYNNDYRYRELWGGKPLVHPYNLTPKDSEAPKVNTGILPCVYRGDKIGSIMCEPCQGKVSLNLFHCRLYGKCIPLKEVSGISCCATCPSREGEGMSAVKWSYGVMTVPQRRTTLLPGTLESLRMAGFHSPHLFVDGANGGYDYLRAKIDPTGASGITYRYPNVRTFGNFILSLAELYIREPNADRYALFQDDFVTVRHLRAYLDRCPYPGRGYLNLYSFRENEQLEPFRSGKMGWVESNQMGRGAVALVFDRDCLQSILSKAPALTHFVNKPLDSTFGWRRADGALVEAIRNIGYKEYIHNPSLVQHTGDVSTIGNHNSKSITWRGEEYNPLTLLEGNVR